MNKLSWLFLEPIYFCIAFLCAIAFSGFNLLEKPEYYIFQQISPAFMSADLFWFIFFFITLGIGIYAYFKKHTNTWRLFCYLLGTFACIRVFNFLSNGFFTGMATYGVLLIITYKYLIYPPSRFNHLLPPRKQRKQ